MKKEDVILGPLLREVCFDFNIEELTTEFISMFDSLKKEIVNTLIGKILLAGMIYLLIIVGFRERRAKKIAGSLAKTHNFLSLFKK